MIRWPSRCCAHRGCRAHGLAAVHGGDRSTFGFLIRGAHATRVPVWRLAQTNFESRRKKSRKMNQERRKRGFDFRSTLNHQLSTFFSGGHSSVGRAPALQAGSQGFESPCLQKFRVAKFQMTFEGMRILFDRWGAKRRVKSEAHWLEASIRAANPLVSSLRSLRKSRAETVAP